MLAGWEAGYVAVGKPLVGELVAPVSDGAQCSGHKRQWGRRAGGRRGRWGPDYSGVQKPWEKVRLSQRGRYPAEDDNAGRCLEQALNRAV